ncbi:MAG: EamA family transporter RarD [Alphaproteobacteria bacterium]|nr:EamA family transporter RarD [Alphaproteobacteria bacterium]
MLTKEHSARSEDREIAAADLGEPIAVSAQKGTTERDDSRGIALALAAYALWGIMPLYWRLLSQVPPFEITVNRVMWCAVFVLGVSLARGRWQQLVAMASNPVLLGILALTSVLISVNWTIYIYCVATHQLVEASLGYYINPLVSIVLGVTLFGERLSRWRLVAVVLATAAVAVKAFELGHFPWIAPALALSFGFYGYFRKRVDVDSLDGLTVETWILFPLTFGLVLFWGLNGTGTFPSANPLTDTLLILGGPITALPLTLFAAGARRIRLSTLGFLQYFSPSITLALAVFGFGEPFTRIDAITFGCVWAALGVVALESRFSR